MKKYLSVKLLPLLYLSLFVSCSANKRVGHKQKKPLNTFQLMCSCENSRGETIESYAKQERKILALSDEEYELVLFEQMKKGEHWIFDRFLKEEGYMTNYEKMKPTQDTSGVNLGLFLDEVHEFHPYCSDLLPLLFFMKR